jgi:hypothetical protein
MTAQDKLQKKAARLATLETTQAGSIGDFMGFYDDALPTAGRHCLTCNNRALGWTSNGHWMSQCCKAVHKMGRPDTLVQ